MTDKKVVIVGVGALGSHVLLFARNLDARFVVVDFDRIEQKNVLSQFHTRPGVGRNKAQALAQAMQGLFNLKIEAVPHKLGRDNVATLLGGAAVVVDCLDNGESRRVVQDYARANSVPCLHGALSADGQLGRVVWDEVFAIDDESAAGQATCEGGEHLPFIAGVAAALAGALSLFLREGAKESRQILPSGVVILDRR